MSDKIHRYQADPLTITYDLKRCIHAEECIKRLPAVFDRSKRVWIQPENAPANVVKEVVARCPSGALHFECKQGSAEPIPTQNTITLAPNGPLYVRGNLEIIKANGVSLHETRAALCRCGASNNKPFCDNAHIDLTFEDAGSLKNNDLDAAEEGSLPENKLVIKATLNGSYSVEGQVSIQTAEGRIFTGTRCWLCRCGGSENKPFCDSTHSKIGFRGD